jgi:hypothetical protein
LENTERQIGSSLTTGWRSPKFGESSERSAAGPARRGDCLNLDVNKDEPVLVVLKILVPGL